MFNVIEEAKYIIDTNKTIREAARHFKMSKSTLHRHMHKYLEKMDYNLYLQVKNVFLEHNKVRHINGGLATKYKYSLKDDCSEGNDFILCR